MSWSVSGGYIQLSGSGLYRNITVTQYFSGTATVKCEWDYKLTSNGRYTHTSRYITIDCRENPVSISPTYLELAPGETAYVSYRHKYDNQYISAARPYYSVSDPNIVSVSSNGLVTAKNIGTTYINVFSKVSNAANAPYCRVVVKSIQPTSVSLTKEISIPEGYTRTLSPTLYPSNAKTTFTWNSSDTDVATVSSSGTIKGIKPGNATISVTTANGLTAKCDVEVLSREPKAISISPSEAFLEAGETINLKASIEPEYAYSEVEWQSNDQKIATVNDKGLVTGVSEGKTTITATTNNGLICACSIEVVPQPENISFKDKKITLIKGYGQKMLPQTYPTNSHTTYSWQSSDNSVATVNSNGWVTAKNEGEAIIKCLSKNGLSATIKIVVESASPGKSAYEISNKLKNVDILTKKITNKLSK